MKSFSKIKGNNIPVKNKEKPPSVSYIHSTPRGNKTAVSLFISGTEKKETGNYEIDRKYPKPFSLLFLFSAGMKIRPQGRSSDLFRIRCLPGTIPVAKSIGTHISPETGTIRIFIGTIRMIIPRRKNLQQRELSPISTAFPFNPSDRPETAGNHCDYKEENKKRIFQK